MGFEAKKAAGAGPNRRIGVLCFKWGTAYKSEYVNLLFRAVTDCLSYEHEFVCVTDDSAGLDAGISCAPLKIENLPEDMRRKGMWQKLYMYNPDISGKFDIVLYLDLDVVITGKLDKLVDILEEKDGFYMVPRGIPFGWRLLPEFLRPRRTGNSSVLVFRPADQKHIYEEFHPSHKSKLLYNDERYASIKSRGYCTFPRKWTPIFKQVGVYPWPWSLAIKSYRKKSKDALVFVFNGTPNPTDVIDPDVGWWGTKRRWGYGPVDWVQEYWEKYSDTSKDNSNP